MALPARTPKQNLSIPSISVTPRPTNLVGSYNLVATQGTNPTINIENTVADAGVNGITIKNTAKTIISSTANAAGAICLATTGGAGATVDITSTGGISLAADGDLSLQADGNLPIQTDGGLSLQADGGIKFGPYINVTQLTSLTTGVTANANSGIITTVSATTAAGAVESFTFTNDKLVAGGGSFVIVSLGNYSGTLGTNGTPIVTTDTPALGSVVINVYNAHAANALSGTLEINYLVVRNV